MALVVPETGQLVEVRQRRFAVVDVQGSQVGPDLVHDGPQSLQHLVTLSSVEDDGLGEELQVVWELEPGARVHQAMGLPEATGFDEPRRLDAFLDAVRWGAVSQADVSLLQAPFRSGIQIEDYQLDPVARALKMPRVSLLIADDVGLGKTIEAGLVAQELLLRHRIRTILVICPSALQIKWRDELRDKFGLEFRIVDSALMRELRRQRGLHVNPWTHFPRLITSIDYLKRDRPTRLFREALPAEGQAAFPRRFDLLIIDEAHNVAPPAAGRYATDSLRTQAVRMLAPHFEHKLFITATPHNGYRESFSALLELLDDQRFARVTEVDREQLAAVMVRRLKDDLKDWDGRPQFRPRELRHLEVAYTPEEQQAHAWLKAYATSRLDEAGAADGVGRFATEFVLKLLKKRLFSSPQAFLTTLDQHLRTLAGRRATPAGGHASMGILQRLVDQVEEDHADDDVYEESTRTALESTTRQMSVLSDVEQSLLANLYAWAEQAAGRPDSKAQVLIEWLNAELRPGGRWGERRVIVFTEYRATQKWLHDLLVTGGLAGNGRLMVLYGGMPTEDRERIKAAFQARPDQSPVRILLATDAASEGIDLQNHCHRLIHYEIPWNPVRLEQRNGRIDRHGQRQTPLVHHFVGQGFDLEGRRAVPPGELAGDLEFLMRAALKVETIRQDLGKVGPVIASQVEAAMLGRRRELNTHDAERQAQPQREMLRVERNLRDRVQRLHDQLHDSVRELHLTPERVAEVVTVGLELAGQPPLRPAQVDGLWPDPAGRRSACPVFHLPALTGSWARCVEGLAHPHTHEVRPILFDHALAEGRDDVVLAHLNHRLVQMCLRLLRAEVWATEGRRSLHRMTARLVPNEALDTPAAVAHGRLVVLGRDSHRLHEEILTAGGLLREGRFSRMNVSDTEAALAAALPSPVPAGTEQRLLNLWPDVRGPLLESLKARMRDRTETLDSRLNERRDQEAEHMRAILEELARGIEAELAGEDEEQLRLFQDDEQQQYRHDRESLQARLDQIPDEIEREVAAIHGRYADPDPRLFPVAVTFLVPERRAR